MMLYVIGAFETGPLKIGKANDPQHRLKSLQIGNPLPLELFLIGDGRYDLSLDDDCIDDYSAEKLLHSKFAHKCLLGEWFELTLSELFEEMYFTAEHVDEALIQKHRLAVEERSGLWLQPKDLWFYFDWQ